MNLSIKIVPVRESDSITLTLLYKRTNFIKYLSFKLKALKFSNHYVV